MNSMNNENRICYIVGAGSNYGIDFKPRDNDCVIAADGGTAYLEEACILPDYIIGDFDSLGYVPKGDNIIKLKVQKDDTDMMVAVKKGIELGYDVFCIYCGCGGRLDHTVGNIQILAMLSSKGFKGYLVSKDQIFTCITDSSIEFDETAQGIISVFSYSDEAVGVTETGLKYELNNYTLNSRCPLGISNEFIGIKSKICVIKGTLLIGYTRGDNDVHNCRTR